MPPTKTKFPKWTLLVGIILLGAFLRLHNINRVSLRGDEAFTITHWVREPLAQTLDQIATKDPQPPLMYALYRAWGLIVGTSEYTIRFLPALINTVGCAVLYALGKRIGGWRVGMLAALLWAIHPYQIWHAQDARNYAIWAVASPLAVWLALRALDRTRWVDWLLYALAAALAAYTYYLELFSLATLTLYVLLIYRRNPAILKRWIATMVIVGVTLAVWFLQPRLLVGSGYGGTAQGFDAIQLVTWFIPSLMFGEYTPLSTLIVLLIITMLVVSLIIVWRVDRLRGLLLMLLSVLPLLGLGIVSLKLNVFTPRYVLMVSSTYVVVVTYAWIVLWRSRSGFQRGVARLSFMGVMGVTLYSLSIYLLSDYAKSPNWRALATYLQQNATADSAIIQTAADQAYTFYHTEYDLPGEPFQLPANPQQPADEIISVATVQASTHSALWVVAQPPNWPNNGVLQEWLDANLQQVRSTVVGGLQAREYRPWNVSPDELQAPMAHFGTAVTLVGAHVFSPEPNQTLTVWLYWQPLEQTDSPLKVFVHLYGDLNPATGSPLWSQDDQAPQNDRIETTTWEPNTVYRDVYDLPLQGVPPDHYSLAVGLYDPVTGDRLPVAGGDHFIFGEIDLP